MTTEYLCHIYSKFYYFPDLWRIRVTSTFYSPLIKRKITLWVRWGKHVSLRYVYPFHQSLFSLINWVYPSLWILQYSSGCRRRLRLRHYGGRRPVFHITSRLFSFQVCKKSKFTDLNFSTLKRKDNDGTRWYTNMIFLFLLYSVLETFNLTCHRLSTDDPVSFLFTRIK